MSGPMTPQVSAGGVRGEGLPPGVGGLVAA